MKPQGIDRLKNGRERLDQLSSSYCLVKWRHATLNFATGSVKSCCHLPFRPVDLASTTRGHQLHDTAADQYERKQMINGERPQSCEYCWAMEDLGHYSDRIDWSSQNWMEVDFKNENLKDDVFAKAPTWLELNFSSKCNLKCSYCSPIYSHRWEQEIREFGHYPTDPGHNHLKYLQDIDFDEPFDPTEFLNAFWPWFKDIFHNLMLLKVTGGEPLLSEETFRIMEMLRNQANRNLRLSINTNASVPAPAWARFIEILAQLKANNSLKKFYLHPSLDTFGSHAEYIRHGLNFKIFKKNIEEYLDKTGYDLIFTCTLNNLSLFSLMDFWKYILELKQRYPKQWISISTHPLVGPNWQSLQILPAEHSQYLKDVIQFARDNQTTDTSGFTAHEIQELTRALDFMNSPLPEKERAQSNFYLFFKEHDRRRKTSFENTFPELKDFWYHCSQL